MFEERIIPRIGFIFQPEGSNVHDKTAVRRDMYRGGGGGGEEKNSY